MKTIWRQPHVARVAQLALASTFLSWAVIYNGFPLVDYDSGTHIGAAAGGRIFWLRSPLYGHFVRIFDGDGWSLWPVTIAQGFIGAYLIYLVARTLIGRAQGVRWYLWVIIAISALTSLPWVSGQIMPDVFAGYTVLGMFLLGLCADQLTRIELAAVFVMVTFSIGAHFSHVPLAAGIAALILCTTAVRDWRAAIRPRFLLLLNAPMAIAVVGLILFQGLSTGHWGFATETKVLTLAGLVADGPATAFLRDECPERGFALCSYADELPVAPTAFLFRPDSIVSRVGGRMALAAEAQAVVIGTIRRYPLWVVQVAARNTWHQLWRFQTGRQLVPLPLSSTMNWTPLAIKTNFPALYVRYTQSRQSSNRLHLALIRPIHSVATWSAIAAFVPFLVMFVRWGDRLMVQFMLVVAAGLAINAFACGAISVPVARFQSRVVWLIVLVALVGAGKIIGPEHENRSHRANLGPRRSPSASIPRKG